MELVALAADAKEVASAVSSTQTAANSEFDSTTMQYEPQLFSLFDDEESHGDFEAAAGDVKQCGADEGNHSGSVLKTGVSVANDADSNVANPMAPRLVSRLGRWASAAVEADSLSDEIMNEKSLMGESVDSHLNASKQHDFAEVKKILTVLAAKEGHDTTLAPIGRFDKGD